LVSGNEPDPSESLREIGHDLGRVIALAASEDVQRSYDMATDGARALSVFGSPNLMVGEEICWDNDRRYTP
jgi:2-hydroxychromene-2-carboxylate isomerase